jgi:hypothetical protein
VEQVDPRKPERQGQQTIQHEAEQKSGEKEEGRSRDDACRSRIVHLLSRRVLTHVGSPQIEGDTAKIRASKMTTKVS